MAPLERQMDEAITQKVCLRCGHTWWPLKPGRPAKCASPECGTTAWDREYVKPPRNPKRRQQWEAAKADAA